MEFVLQNFNTPICVERIANIHYFEFTNHFHTANDSHSFCELLYVDRGEIIVESENYTGTLSDNQIILHRPNEVHSFTCDESVAPNVIIIGFECYCRDLDVFSRVPVNLTSDQKRLLADIMKEGRSVFMPPYDQPNTYEMKKKEDAPYGADQVLKIKLELFLISLVREDTKCQSSSYIDSDADITSRIKSIHQYVTENYKEKILLESLCFIFGTNKTTLCKEFKNHYKTTIIQYINSLKIKEIKALLREGEMSVTEISEIMGFNSIGYFSKFFKNHTGKTPKEYAQSIAAKFDK